MSFDLTDRGIKLLYRQRGSRLRKLDPDDDDLVISGPSMGDPVDSIMDPAPIGYELMDFEPVDNEPVDSEPVDNEPVDPEPVDPEPVDYEPVDPEPVDYEPVDYQPVDDGPSEHKRMKSEPDEKRFLDHGMQDEHEPAQVDEDVLEPVSYYNFQDMPLRQLSSSITSITSIDVLISMFTNLFQNDLISQAMKDFEQTSEKRLKMSYKLDVRIFESILEQLINDFKDILDINMSNNELCYQLRQIVSVREDLSIQLVAVRKELQALKCGGELYQVNQESQTLDDRVELNNKLNDLTGMILGQSHIPETIPMTTATDIEDFCNEVNPYSGTLARIQKFNEMLRKQND